MRTFIVKLHVNGYHSQWVSKYDKIINIEVSEEEFATYKEDILQRNDIRELAGNKALRGYLDDYYLPLLWSISIKSVVEIEKHNN